MPYPCRTALFTLIVAAAIQPARAASPNALAFVQANCKNCHNASVSSGGIDFTSLPSGTTFTANREIWERVEAKLKAGEMPPPGVPKPPAADIGAVTAWLESEFSWLMTIRSYARVLPHWSLFSRT